jgi:hypothetical protein
MATDTKQEQEYERRPWDKEDENGFNNVQSQVPAGEESWHETDDFKNNDTQGGDLAGRAQEDKANINQSDPTAPSAVEEAPKENKPGDEAGGFQKQAAPSRTASNPSTTNQQGNTTTTAPTRPKSQPLPSALEEKGQLVKRKRRRNRKSGYDTSNTEEMPLTQRQQPLQQQIQPQDPPKKNEPLRLRLDLNLDIEVELKARIHGDVTLALFS